MAAQAIILDRLAGVDTGYRVCLWADVPAAYQANRRNPKATSANPFATPAELQAIRDGLVAERVVSHVANSGTAQGTVETAIEALCAAYQTEVTGWNNMALCGRRWNGTSWANSAGIPMATNGTTEDGDPGFSVLTPVSGMASNKLHFVLANAAGTTAQGVTVRVRKVVLLPGQAAVTGAAPSVFVLRRRSGATVMPSGSGQLTPVAFDTAQPLPTVVTAWNAPGTPPANGSVETLNEPVPQADEQKTSTMDAPTMASLHPWGGVTIFDAKDAGPLVLRPSQTLEIVQTATGGTGNCRVLCLFTAG